MQDPAAPEGGRLLRVLFIRVGQMPADPAAARLRLYHPDELIRLGDRPPADILGGYPTPTDEA